MSKLFFQNFDRFGQVFDKAAKSITLIHKPLTYFVLILHDNKQGPYVFSKEGYQIVLTLAKHYLLSFVYK